MAPLVVILMGSKSDSEHCQAIADGLAKLGVAAEMRIGSAHKTPEHVLELLRIYEADPRPKVYVTVAGRSNALSGFVDAQVRAPVIACPPPSSNFGGADIFSSLRMPGGVAPAVVLEPGGAALLAAKILALAAPEIAKRIEAMQHANIEVILKDDEAVKSKS
jgi:5-(carboxyamino)imidazole ribonucleotide mutase